MAKEVISVGGEQRVVREDTAKSYRGVMWALISVFGFALIAAIVFFAFFLGGASDGDIRNPSQIEQQRR